MSNIAAAPIALGAPAFMAASGTGKNVRPECHAASTFRVSDLSASGGASSPRGKKRATILAYWESVGIARFNRRAGGVWEVRDILHDGGVWLPLATQGEEARADRAVFSHVFASEHGGAWCACNVLPENGAANTSRGSLNIGQDGTDLNLTAVSVLRGWRGYWTKRVARPASLKRMGL